MRLKMGGPVVNRAIAATTMFAMTAGTSGCGYLLYPERRGQLSGRIDSGTMVMDLLWLLPGIIPGVVALVVDFSSGAIYVRGSTAVRLSPDGRVAVRLPESSKPASLHFRLVTSSHRVVARKTVAIGPLTAHGQSIELQLGGAASDEEVYLEVQTDEGVSARLATSIEVASGA